MENLKIWIVSIGLYLLCAACLGTSFLAYNDETEIEVTDESSVVSTAVEAEEDVSEVGVLTKTYFDVPLDHALQDHIFAVSEEYGIDPALVIAVIQKESNFHADSIGDSGNSLGLMQIQPKWHQARMDKLNCPDLLNPYHNVSVGINYLADLFGRGKSVEWVLMAYNSGPSNANKNEAQGIVSSYAKAVLNNINNLQTIEMGV